MNELLLIDMMGELDPALLQDNYMEKDMKKERLFFFKNLFFIEKVFFSKKSLKETDKFTPNNPLSWEYESKSYEKQEEFDEADKNDDMEIKIVEEEAEEDLREWEFNISIFEKKFKPLYGIVSGVAATAIVVSGIVVIIVKRHRAILG